MTLNDRQRELCESHDWDFSDLRGLYINCTLKRAPRTSHTRGLMDVSMEILLARTLRDRSGIPAHGNQRSAWDAGCRFDHPNPEHR